MSLPITDINTIKAEQLDLVLLMIKRAERALTETYKELRSSPENEARAFASDVLRSILILREAME